MSREIPSKQKPIVVDLTTDKEKYLVGWPGYRNANGRSGLGYVETQAEWAHMEARLFRMMITGKVITRNPVFLVGMFMVGLIYSLPLILGFPDMLSGSVNSISGLLITSPYWLFGFLILSNVFIAVFGRSVEDEEGRESDE